MAQGKTSPKKTARTVTRAIPKTATKTTTKRRPTSYPMSFRVGGAHLAQLERGAAQSGISIQSYARVRLLELLDREEEVRLVEEAKTTRREVGRLRSDVALTLEILLLNLTQGDPHKIRGWIDAHLRERADDGERDAQAEDGEA